MTIHNLGATPRIRKRLFRLLLQAFGLVVLLTTLLVLTIIGISVMYISRDSSSLRPEQAFILETYYQGRGNWEDVDTIAAGENIQFSGIDVSWSELVVLDEMDHVILDHGQTDTPAIGAEYKGGADALQFPLVVENQEVGTIIIDARTVSRSFNLSTRLFSVVAFLSFFPGVLTVILAMFLARRVITPLAEVIAAAREVAAGNRAARVEARGPDDLRDLIESFNQMASAIEQDEQERRSMLADIAHELRTPLTVIRGRLEGIIDGVYPVNEVNITPVLEEVYLLERLVEDLRLLTLAESHQLPLNMTAINLNDTAERAALLFEAGAIEKDITIAVHRAENIPMVIADPQRIGQVINNLLANALRHTPTGSEIVLTVEHTSSNSVSFSIRDQGQGVTEHDLSRIFKRFWRQEKARSRVTGGAGLGLAIAHQLINVQGGTILASNHPDGGLVVRFTLPVEMG